MSKVLTVEPEQIKRVQNRLALAPQKLIEAADAMRVKADNLAVNDRALHGQFGQGFLQGLEAKVALVPRNDLTLAARAGRGRDRWKLNLQVKLCDTFGLTATVCHYPAGCSKWNPVEHRLFSYISMNWQGKPLKTLEIMLGYIRGTSTATGLKVKAF